MIKIKCVESSSEAVGLGAPLISISRESMIKQHIRVEL